MACSWRTNERREASRRTGRVLSGRVWRPLLALLGWTAAGLLFSLPALSNGGGWRPLLGSLAQWWSWGLVTPLILAADSRLPFSDRQLPRRMAAHLLVSLPLTTAHVYISAALRALLGVSAWGPLLSLEPLMGALRGAFLWSWLVYWLILGAWQAFRYYEHYLSGELRMERLERRFSEARLQTLRLQLDPHFLFNALNTISSQLERDPRLARGMIEHLGELLRLSLDSKGRQEVPLEEELAFLRHYLAIQKVRFGAQLSVVVDVPPALQRAAVPSLLLQPLVENAIRHGLASRASGGTVSVSARLAADRLELRVQDDGVGLPPAWRLDSSTGLGLSVTRERIAGLHPDGTSAFSVGPRVGGGTEVVLSVPLRMIEEEPHGHAAATHPGAGGR